MNAKKRIVLFSLCLLLLAGAFPVHKRRQNYRAVFEKRKAAWTELKQTLRAETGKFKGDVGIVVKDLSTRWEISFNKDRLFPSASLPKIPIMAACFLAAEEGQLKLERDLTLKAADKVSGSGTLKNTPPGSVFTVEELIGLMIYDSDNTAANILTTILGIDYLNDSFNSLGLRNTNLARKIADFHSRNNGIENYTSAEDMASILERIYLKKLVNKNISESCLELLKLQRVNDRIPKYLPGDIITAHKTGLERGICHDVGIIFTGKGDLLVCVLTKHANKNSKPSKEFIAKVALHAYSYAEKL